MWGTYLSSYLVPAERSFDVSRSPLKRHFPLSPIVLSIHLVHSLVGVANALIDET